MTNLTAPHFTDADKAREHLEALRWPNGAVCPHCQSVNAQRLPAQRGRPTKAHPEGAVRDGIYQCRDCRKQFSVTVGTVFESSKVPLNKWLLATHLLCASKKGMSAHQLHRMLGITYKTAWFMFHRIRESMREGELAVPFGSGGGGVEVDETYIGRLKGQKVRQSGAHKMKVISLVDRDTGRVRSYAFDQMISTYVEPICKANIAKEARLITDGARLYKYVGKHFASHESVDHSANEYVRGDVFTNTVEGSFSIFKRGMKGVYQHCGEQHLHRYLAEFDFRYSNRAKLGISDDVRAERALKGIGGKRLTYRRSDEQYA
nr:IS1595 family transposase [Rhizorhabdus wittichii]